MKKEKKEGEEEGVHVYVGDVETWSVER